MSLKIDIRQGRGGKHRWFLFEDDVYVSHSRPYGNRKKAHRAAQRHFGQGVEIVALNTDEHSPLYAGERDLADI